MSGQLDLNGAGTGIGGESDSFNFLFTRLIGDGVITVRLWDFEPQSGRGKAGLMLRSTLSTDSANVLLFVDGDHSATIQARPVDGTETVARAPVRGLEASTWLQLGRWGDRIIGRYSTNGFDWYEVGRYRLDFGQEVHLGLVVTSEEPQSLTSASFTDLHLDLQASLEPPPPVTDTVLTQSDSDGLHLASTWVCSSSPLVPTYRPTLFVAPEGDDDNAGTEVDRPLRTLQRAAVLATTGDVVWVRNGVYREPVLFQGTGTQSSPIVFESYPGECAVLEGSPDAKRQPVRFENAQYYIFRNFEIRESPEQGIYLLDSSDIMVSHVRSHGNGLSGIQNVGGKRNHFTHFIVHDNSDGTRGDADGIGISSGEDHKIDTCVSFRNSDDGIDAWRSHRTVIERCISFENGFQGGNGNGFKAGGGLPDGDAVLRNNIAFDNKSEGFTYNSGHGILFENNTAFNNGIFGFSAANSTLRNNLSFGNDRADWVDDGGNVQENNSWELRLTRSVFRAVDRHSPEFLALTAEGIASSNGQSLETPEFFGALPFGETIVSFLRIDLANLLDY